MDGVDELRVCVIILGLAIVYVVVVFYIEWRFPANWPIPREQQLRMREERKLAKKVKANPNLRLGPNPRQRELAYLLINGDVHLEDARLAGLRPQLDALEDSIYQHRMKLCTRAGLDFEDADIEGIISAYEKLNRLCADGMYDQGWIDAGQVPGA